MESKSHYTLYVQKVRGHLTITTVVPYILCHIYTVCGKKNGYVFDSYLLCRSKNFSKAYRVLCAYVCLELARAAKGTHQFSVYFS